MRYTKAGQADILQLRAIWKQAFGDSDAFLDHFFSGIFPQCQAFCARDGEEIVGAVYALETVLAKEEQSQKAAYLYAVATKSDRFGQGICTNLLDFSVKKLQSKGVFCVFLACKTPELAAFYQKRGFFGAQTVEKGQLLPPPAGVAAVISAVEYAGLRETLLFDAAHIRYPKALLELTGATFYRLQTQNTFGCACAVKEAGKLRILEYLPDARILPALSAAVGAGEVFVSDGQFLRYGDTPPFYAPFTLD